MSIPVLTSPQGKRPEGRGEVLLRSLLLVYVAVVATPMRFWVIRDTDMDCTWLFALNYGAAHGLAFGRDLLWSNGPLGFLTFPQNIGHNLAYGLLFQACAWLILIAIFADLFLRAGIPLSRLALFSLAIGLASPLFWFNRCNTDTVFLTAALALLILVRFEGGTLRYLTALVLIGIVPFIKLSAALGVLALFGFLIDQVIRQRAKAWRDIVLAAVIPSAVAAFILWLTIPSWQALWTFIRGSRDLFRAYSEMSLGGPAWELFAGYATLLAIGFLVIGSMKPDAARFFTLLLAPSLWFSFKHGFVRQDDHVVNFFCFAILVVGLTALHADFSGWHRYLAFAIVLLPFLICIPHLYSYKTVLADMTGLRTAREMWQAWRSETRGQTRMQEKMLMGDLAPAPAVGPEIRSILGDSSVAFLSLGYTGAYFDNVNLSIYPVVQRYSTYTPYLDALNAEWIRTKGPRFLVFDGKTVDNHHPWAETPATWLEVFRNYDTRLLTKENLLLERRPIPRFASVKEVNRFQIAMPGELDLPSPEVAPFWSLSCHLTKAGSLRKLLFRAPVTTMVVATEDGHREEYRSITEVLTTPVMGTWLPGTLPELAEVLQDSPPPSFRNRKLIFDGEGARFYESSCEARFFRAVK